MITKIKNLIDAIKRVDYKRVKDNIEQKKQDTNYYDMLSIEHTITRGIKKIIKKNSSK